MAHGIAMINGRPALAYVGQMPWHELGTELRQPPNSAEELIQAANLDWEVDKKPVYAYDNGTLTAIPGYWATYRADLWGTENAKPFGVVRDEYHVLQNRDAFSFFDAIIESGDVTYETAGALGQGERVWVLAKVKDPMVIKGTDLVEKYLLLSNGHDGRTAVQIRFTPVRVVCQNTLNYALYRGSDLVYSHHGRGMDSRIARAQESVKRVLGYYDALEKHFQQLARVPMPVGRLNVYFAAVFPNPKRRAKQTERTYAEALKRVAGLRSTSARLFEEGRGNNEKAIRHTLWTAYNAVTELVDHFLAYQNGWQRMESICFGEGERTKRLAFDEAMKLARN